MTFKIPPGVLAQHMIAIGKTGSGKSSKLRIFVEQLLRAGEPVTILDVKGDWWGIKSSANGKEPGFPVVIFGGKHADLPLNAAAGKELAEVVCSGNRPCVIDMRGLSHRDRSQLFIDFTSTAYRINKGKRYIVISEVHNFAFKGKVFSPQAGEMLHWANTLASEGRGLGLTVLADSQRGQKVHNDFLTSMETLIACKVIHKSDRDAIKDWIDGCADIEVGKQVLASLAQLKKPEAWMWCPEIDYGPERVTFPLFSTFDSFKPQELDTPAQLKGWATVDLEELKGRLITVLEQAKANDPATLKKKIAELERQLAGIRAEPAITQEYLQEHCRRKYNEGQATGYAEGTVAIRDRMNDILNLSDTLGAEFLAKLREIKEAIEHAVASIPKTPSAIETVVTFDKPPPKQTRFTVAQRPAPIANGSSEIPAGGRRRIMTALAQFPEGLSQRRLALLVDIAPKGGTWRTYMGELRGKGWVEGGRDRIQITDVGARALGSYDPLPTGEALISYWRQRLGDTGKRKIFDFVVRNHPSEVVPSVAADACEMAFAGGTWRTYMGELRGLGLIEGTKMLRLSPELVS